MKEKFIYFIQLYTIKLYNCYCFNYYSIREIFQLSLSVLSLDFQPNDIDHLNLTFIGPYEQHHSHNPQEDELNIRLSLIILV